MSVVAQRGLVDVRRGNPSLPKEPLPAEMYPVTNAELTRTLARVLHRPAVLPVPAAAIRLAFGEFARDLLASARVAPKRLAESGYEFRHPELEPALRELLGR